MVLKADGQIMELNNPDVTTLWGWIHCSPLLPAWHNEQHKLSLKKNIGHKPRSLCLLEYFLSPEDEMAESGATLSAVF